MAEKHTYNIRVRKLIELDFKFSLCEEPYIEANGTSLVNDVFKLSVLPLQDYPDF